MYQIFLMIQLSIFKFNPQNLFFANLHSTNFVPKFSKQFCDSRSQALKYTTGGGH